jgi:hypothetical protein
MQTPKRRTTQSAMIPGLGKTSTRDGNRAHLLPVSICAGPRRLTHGLLARLGLIGVRHPADSIHAELGLRQDLRKTDRHTGGHPLTVAA